MSLPTHQASLVDETTDPPGLRGGSCRACGYRFFPFQDYGCERCGASGSALRRQTWAGRGRLLARALVDRGADSFVMARVALEAGVEVRALLDGASAEPPTGAALTAIRVPVASGPDGHPAFELRFRAEKS